MKDPDQSVTWGHGLGDDLAERLWAYEDPDVIDDDTADDPTTGLVGLRFLGAVLRRGRWLWCGLAVVGLLIGSAYYVGFPPAHKASASVLLADDPSQDPTVEVQTDIALAQSTVVADGAISQLGLHQTVSSFLGSHTVALVTDHVLSITGSTKSSAEAVRIASAVATQFLKIRAQ